MNKPRSVYVHVPFCRHRCGYCNFTLVAGRDHLIDDYLQAVEIEMSQIEGRPEVDTIYLGGGTPTRLPAKALSFLLKLIDQRFRLNSDGEFTIEANPDDLPGDIASVIDDSAINRISLGIQSFNLKKLRSLDRAHSLSDIDSALKCSRQIVDLLSIDLIFAAPHDDPDTWQADLTNGIASGATHISTYELTFEKGTRFWNQLNRGELTKSDEPICEEYYQTAMDRLGSAGFEHYEISSFASAGDRSRHNQVYWNGNPWLAFGPGASGFLGGFRYTNHRSVSRYLKLVLDGSTPIAESQQLSASEMAIERVVFGLRMIEGIDLVVFRERFGMELTDIVPETLLQKLAEQQLLERDEKCLKLTSAGVLLGDHVCASILNESVPVH